MKYKTVKIPEELYKAVDWALPGKEFNWKIERILKEYVERLIEDEEFNLQTAKKCLTAYCNEKIAQRTEYKPNF